MTPPRPVREIALGILLRVARGAHAAPLLDARGRDLDGRDRDFLRALVKKTLRGAIRLDHVLGRHLRQPAASLDPPVLAALRLGASQLLLMDRVPPHAAVGETVAAARAFVPKAAGLVNAILRRVAERESRPGDVRLPGDADPLLRLALETSHPEWLVRRWVAAFGPDAARAALEADDVDAPTDLLADPKAGSVDEVLAALAAGGVTAERSPWAPLALTVTGGNAASHPLVSGGALAVVDVAAQALASLLPRADVAADLTAAPGGRRASFSPRASRAASSPSSGRPRAPRVSPRISPPRGGGTKSSSSGRTPGRPLSRSGASTRSSSTRRARAPGRFERTRKSACVSRAATSPTLRASSAASSAPRSTSSRPAARSST